MNRLATETSPYLLQHADNPVHWYPWGEEALAQAEREQKPILLSVGYSACHWCHVMAHESFEDDRTAALMNDLFINIKVDREERPDLDKIYQTAHQLITRRPGGWPLTMFLDHQTRRPFFGGTYFPGEARYGMPAFGDVLRRVAEYYRDHREEISEHSDALMAAFASLEAGAPASAGDLSEKPLAAARDLLAQQFDRDHGGFGSAPKFPHPSNLERLLRHWRATAHSGKPDTDTLYMCALTLTRMAEGGIYDQLGGGFCRYAVDATWTIPHFEKMLYDNGPLLALYAQLWQVSGDDLYRRVASETADWAIRDMHSPEGGFYSALDADSEGEEGRFYVWTPDQARALLSAEQYDVLAARFGLDQPPNFEGRWHLQVRETVENIGQTSGLHQSGVARLLDEARSRLLAARDARVWPGRDEKVLASWNALMMRGLAIAGRVLRREDLILVAGRCLDFVREQMVTDGRLCASYKDGRARFDAYLDDHAYLLDASLELLQAHWNGAHLEFAIWLADRLLEDFQDRENGGFFFTANDHEALIHRSKPMADDAIPAGNGIAALALNRLGHLLGESRYLSAAERTLRAGWSAMAEVPHAHATLLNALEEYLEPAEIVVIRGAEAELASWKATLAAVYAPRRLVLGIPATAMELPGGLAAREPGESTLAYVCRGATCSLPITSLEALTNELSESNA
jgi:uncharacterized protein YyaL (SSP411 family)